MGESFVHHITVSVLAFLLGAFFGAVYDVIRIIRLFFGIRNYNVFEKIGKTYIRKFEEEKKIGKVYESIVVGVTDLIFFAIISIFMMIFVHLANSGIVRWYIYVMAVLGFISYYKTIGKVVLSLFVPIVYYVKKAVSTGAKALCYPAKRIIIVFAKKRKAKTKNKKEETANINRNVLLHTGK